MIRCKRCVIPSTRPDTPFVDGVCSACLSYEKRPQIDWDARKKELVELLDRHDGKVIVPSSGGKDSTYQVITLLEMGADVTVVTATTCHLTAIGRANIDNLARFARTIEVSPNKTVRAKLNRLGLELVGDISWPEHASIFSTPFRMAKALNIPLIMFGENPQNCYGGPLGTEEAKQMTKRWTQEFGGFLGLRPSDFVGMEGITERDMRDYLLPDDMEGLEAHFLGQYIEWDSHRNGFVSIRNGMQYELPSFANSWLTENQDNAQTGIHDHVMFRKFGYGRGCAQISVDVRAGRATRNDAMQWVDDHDGVFPYKYMQVPYEEVLSKIGMAEDRFWQTLHRFTSAELFDGEEDHRPRFKVCQC